MNLPSKTIARFPCKFNCKLTFDYIYCILPYSFKLQEKGLMKKLSMIKGLLVKFVISEGNTNNSKIW